MKKATCTCTDLKSRFRVLAGIVKKDTLATLTIPNGDTVVQLKTVPTWFDKLKYKLCGFECRIIREIPAEDCCLSEKDIDNLVTELENE